MKTLKIAQIELNMLKIEKRILAAERKTLRLQSKLLEDEYANVRNKIRQLTKEIDDKINPKIAF